MHSERVSILERTVIPMGKKNNNKNRTAITDIDSAINLSEKKYDKDGANESIFGDSPDGPSIMKDNAVLSDMMKQYKDIDEALKNDAQDDLENMKKDDKESSKENGEKDYATKHAHLNGGIFDLDEEPTVGETALGVLTLGVLLVGVVAVAKLGLAGIGKVRRFV